MPSQNHARRIKGKRITRPFIIGTEAWKLDDTNRPKTVKPADTTGWRIYVRPVANGPDLSTWLKKVVFRLHETFRDAAVRTVESSPFELEESGYGTFTIKIDLHIQPTIGEKIQRRSHDLVLQPYGDEALRAEQERTGIVRSECIEFIEFNEPTEDAWEALIAEDQWSYLVQNSKGKGLGKGKNNTKALAPQPIRTIELPDKPAMSGSLYSKDTENWTLALIQKAYKTLDDELAIVLEESRQVNEEIASIKEVTEVDVKLLNIHQKIPTKKKHK